MFAAVVERKGGLLPQGLSACDPFNLMRFQESVAPVLPLRLLVDEPQSFIERQSLLHSLLKSGHV